MDESKKFHGDGTPADQLEAPGPLGETKLPFGRFDCPLCKSQSYSPVIITGRNGKPFELPLGMCNGCTVVFGNGWRFKRLMWRGQDDAGETKERVTRGVDDRPKPTWQGAFDHDGTLAPGGYLPAFSKRRG